MIKTSIEKLSSEIGFDIGVSDDITQANLLNGFCKGLSNSILEKNVFQTQLCYIVKSLDSNAKSVLNEIVEFINAEK